MKRKKNIVWLASYPKSGNTWLRILLSHYFKNDNKGFNLNNLITDGIASNRDIFEEATGLDSSEITNDEIDNLRPMVYRYLSESSNQLLYYKIHDANHKNKNNEYLIPEDVTHKVIYLIRNPLDVAVSFAFHSAIEIGQAVNFICNENATFCSTNKLLSFQLRQLVFSWNSHVKSWTEDKRLDVHVVKYEDLLADASGEFEKIIHFIELSVNKSALQYAVKNSKFDKMRKIEDNEGFREKPLYSARFFRKGEMDDWKNYLSGYQVKTIQDCSAEMMEKYGYIR